MVVVIGKEEGKQQKCGGRENNRNVEEEGKQQKCGGRGKTIKMRRKRRENNKNEKDEQEGWVSKTLSSVLKRAI